MDASESPIALIYSIPGLRQLILLAGLALAISAGVTAAFWMKDPGYTVLFSNISQQEAGEMVDALNATDIPHRVDEKTGAVLVPSGKVQEARLKLAGQGLPRGSGSGLEMMDNGNAFATSQFMETARYNHALETELGRTISTLRPVQSARVHLALPESSVFLRKKKEPSASVLVNLYSGRDLDKSQVASVVHLVASSIPGLEPDKVTVVDQHGRLLNAPQDASQLGLSTQQLDYVQRVEESYTERINSLLTPMLGADRVRATVTAEMDFTEHEETREQYDPEKTTVRSEQVAEDRRNDASSATGGVPGALSNTPPPPAVANNAAQPQPAKPGAAPTAPANAPPAAATTAAGGVNESMRRTRNFEVDRTLSHTRQPTGQLKRLSVAVVIDDKRTAQEDGTVKTEHLTQPEIDEITRVVKEAVGLDEKRGDTVSISNVAFYTKPAEAAPAEPGLLDRPGLMENGRNIIAALLLLSLAFVVIRPIMRGLGLGSGGAPQGSGRLVSVGAAGGGGAVSQAMSRTPLSYDDKISVARQLADKNPERVAQIVRAWVQSDE